jgi:hypothetical protein
MPKRKAALVTLAVIPIAVLAAELLVPHYVTSPRYARELVLR